MWIAVIEFLLLVGACPLYFTFVLSVGQLSIFACAVDSLVDFYPMFWDSASQDEGDHTRDCIYEAAFPRTTLVLSYLGLSLVLVLFVRFPLTLLCWRKHPHNNSLCYGLVIVPAVAALFVASSGPLCELLHIR